MTNKHILLFALFNYSLTVIFKLVLNIGVKGYIVTHIGYYIPPLTSHFNMEIMGIFYLLVHLILELCITYVKVCKGYIKLLFFD